MRGVAGECIDNLKGHPEYPPEATGEVGAFLEKIQDMPLDDLQGIYSYTFEIASGEFSMDLSYHIYDGFKRANSLVTMKAMYRDKGFPFDEIGKGELPDNLPVVLQFLDYLIDKDEPLRKNYRETFLVKAIEKLNKNFELKGEIETPYRHLIKALLAVIDTDVKGAAALEEGAVKHNA